MVALPESLRAEVATSTGLIQEEAGAAGSPGYRGANWAFVYRYATVPFELTLAVEKVQPQITVDSLVEAVLLPDRLTLDLTAVYTIEKAGVAIGTAEVTRIPENTVAISGHTAEQVLKLLEALEDHDDIQSVSANFDISDQELAQISAAS